jgi:hypothetical protein
MGPTVVCPQNQRDPILTPAFRCIENRCYRYFAGHAPRGAGCHLVCCPWRVGTKFHGGYWGEGKHGAGAWGARGLRGSQARRTRLVISIVEIDLQKHSVSG